MDRDFTIGDWVVRPERLCIHQPSKTVRITPKSMAVLLALARADGAVVSRNALLDEVWPGAAVTDDVLTHCIVELRKAFDDSAQDPRFIETIPKKGIRLVAQVARIEKEAASKRLGRGFAVAIIAVILTGIVVVWSLRQERPPSLPPVEGTTLAVLPFSDLSPGGEHELFADGLTDELIARLTLLEGLHITGRASSFHFKGRGEDVRSVGEELDVSHVLDGSVRRLGDELKVTARLTDVETGFHVWTESYERRIEDRLEVQEQVAEAVAEALSVGLGVGDLANIVGGTSNVAAYEEYLAGDAASIGANPDTIVAIAHFERATELDPGYALAWARLAEEYHIATWNWGGGEPYRFGERRDQAIAMALSLAPESPQVVAVSAQLKIQKGQYREARLLLDDLHRRFGDRDVRTAIVYVDLSLKIGHLGDAYWALSNILRRDPLNPMIPNYLSHLYLLQGRPDDGLAEIERGIQNDMQSLGLLHVAPPMALATGRRDMIEKWLKKLIEWLDEEWLDVYTFEDAILERLDDRDALLEFLAGIQSTASGVSIDMKIATWAAYLGDDEMALRSLDRAKDPWVFWSPVLKRVRQTDEFKRILVDTGIVDYWREFGWGSFCKPTEGDDFECR
jgi:TolB-like protein/DNA-binding winged helix-turn-helix (wHTH) protein